MRRAGTRGVLKVLLARSGAPAYCSVEKTPEGVG